MPAFCHNCGAAVGSGDRFCGDCGAKLDDPADETPAAHTANEPVDETDEKAIRINGRP